MLLKPEIVPFTEKFKQDFIALNLDWLEEYFYVEDHDIEILNSCEKVIIEPGGHIYLALFEGEVIGCYALLRSADGIYELGKMAVKRSFRGQQVGQQLMQHCLETGKKNNWNRIILYSSVKLDNALHIYRKFGFREIPLEKHSPYKRSSIKMEYIFDKKEENNR